MRWTILAALLLAGCGTIRHSTAPAPGALAAGVVLARALPAELPKASTPVPHSQFILISRESAAGLLVPVPFVTEAATALLHHHDAAQLAAKYASVEPYAVMQQAMAGSPLLSKDGKGLNLHPLAYLLDCDDDQFRVALVARMQSANWTGRYMTHLPSAYAAAALKEAGPAMLEKMHGEMLLGAAALRGMLEKDARGELSKVLYKADVGTLQLACTRVAGMLPPELVLAATPTSSRKGRTTSSPALRGTTNCPARPAA
ncbi:hypothetical protein ASD15_13610 [Massilia sp. Root351]|jgi:hypothetical protein|uniref:hypothetical protein n=1 Tax=Massilia sp. Root351 TaxID=1736522 RepID=UPI00070A2713|nr:hypothetical protein [Massilia sp. Root351]KQV80920.1 hypothetical protein ASD15_13610 [Massilia sp. Root351]